MCLPVPDLAPVLDALHDDDISDPRLRGVLTVVRSVAADGDRPDPVTLTARYEADNGGNGLQGFANTVMDLFTSLPIAGYNVRAYLRATLTDALRRAVRELGYLTQYADAEPIAAVLHEYDQRTARVADLRRRLTDQTTNHPTNREEEQTA